MSEPRLHVLDDPAAAAGAVLAAEAGKGGSIALAGGSTPGEAYAHASVLERDWARASVWWSDERCVPPGDARSNYGLAARTLLDRLERLPQVHRIRGELDPAEAADEYERSLAGRGLDLLMLGLGPDGHVASLFPGSPQLGERSRLVTHGPAALDPFVERVTLTVPALLSARRILVLVTGPAKARAVAAAFTGPVDDDVPGSLLRAGETPLDVYLDRPAAARIAGAAPTA